jgi:5-bromo-4-chloroindolyl phosphate hydrolysis protein
VDKRQDRRDPSRSGKGRFMATPGWTIASFLVGISLGFLMLTEFRTGPVLAGIGALGAYLLMAFGLPRRISPRTDTTETSTTGKQITPTSTDDPRVDLLVEAHQHAATLAAARAHMPLIVAAQIDALHRHSLAIIKQVTQAPEKLTPVLRFFTYYLPSTADLVMDRIKLANHAGGPRLEEIDQTLSRLVEAFAGFEAASLEPDLHSVDLDIELLDQALKADLEELRK